MLPFKICLRWEVIPREGKHSLGGSRGGSLPWERGLRGTCVSESVLIHTERLRGSRRRTWNNPTNYCSRIRSCRATDVEHPQLVCKIRQEVIPRGSGAAGLPWVWDTRDFPERVRLCQRELPAVLASVPGSSLRPQE